MNHLRLFVSLVLFSLFAIGCTMEDGTLDGTVESAIVDTSSASSTATEATADPSLESEAVTEACYQVWDCTRCLNNSNRNILVEYCDDGSERIIHSGPCGQACF